MVSLPVSLSPSPLSLLPFRLEFLKLERVSTPTTPIPQNTYASFEPPPPVVSVENDPDNPPWGAALALLVWLASIVLLAVVQVAAIVPYAVHKASTGATDTTQLANDPNFLLIGILAIIPAHLATFGLVWAVVTRFRKRPFWQSIGWGWPPRFGFWASVGAAVLLFIASAVITQFIPGGKTPFEEMLESSAATRFAAAFMAVATAPLVEELVYRGVLYPALRRAAGMAWAVVIVSVMFAAVHVAQYYNNLGVVASISLLSFALTYVRARTGRVLPCFIIHLVFNGVQVALLIVQYFYPDILSGATKTGLLAPAYVALLPLF